MSVGKQIVVVLGKVLAYGFYAGSRKVERRRGDEWEINTLGEVRRSGGRYSVPKTIPFPAAGSFVLVYD